MGSKLGYAYDFQLAMVGEDEINSKYKSIRKDGVRIFLFEFRTNFILKKRPEYLEEEEEEEEYRLEDYWMTEDEIESLLKKTLDFTRNIASDPQIRFTESYPGHRVP
ncbi:hypothetical protein CASFOL_001159 [Castilleja foliolosa]|uniref:Uncharacterized protein n=1 Tax=Castilleja foliolosa TaxID=1961234 RepID=A0ABD3ELS3_9LAMI